MSLKADAADRKSVGRLVTKFGSRVPPVFLERVRKPLILKELGEYCSVKSAQEYEKEGLNFCTFCEEVQGVRAEVGGW